jgi:CRP-like cAMP-binding protein
MAPGACASCSLDICVFWGSFSHKNYANLTKAIDQFEVSAGQILAKEGMLSPHVWAVIDGAVMGYKELLGSRRQVIRFYFPGDLAALSGSAARSDVTIKAIIPTLVCRIGREALQHLCSGHSNLGDCLLYFSGHETAAASEHMLLLGRKSALEKVASFLVEMSHRTGRDGIIATDFTLPMTRRDIADYLGLKLETVSRMFARLKAADIVQMPNPGRVILHDRQALSALTEMRP